MGDQNRLHAVERAIREATAAGNALLARRLTDTLLVTATSEHAETAARLRDQILRERAAAAAAAAAAGDDTPRGADGEAPRADAAGDDVPHRPEVPRPRADELLARATGCENAQNQTISLLRPKLDRCSARRRQGLVDQSVVG